MLWDTQDIHDLFFVASDFQQMKDANEACQESNAPGNLKLAKLATRVCAIGQSNV